MPEAEQQQQLSPETARLAEMGRSGVDTTPPTDGKPVRPDHVPEKFWDAEKGEVRQDELLKSYAELERTRASGQQQQEDPAPNPDPQGDPDPDPNPQDDPPAENEALAAAFTTARDAYAETGELAAEHREALVAAGIPSDAIDTYLAGVKATELALQASAHEAAGSAEDFAAATAWAAENWSKDEIEAFNASVGNPALVKTTVKGLMASFREAEPAGEGRLTNINGGAQMGDVYTDKDDFLKDLTAADEAGDRSARRKAVEKLERSKKAGTVKAVTPRTGPFNR